jgi:hypothetical protein
VNRMQRLYRYLLRLYPADYFNEYVDEMTVVFSEAHNAVRDSGFRARTLFLIREIRGLLSEVLRLRLCGYGQLGRYEMQTEFRFPRSTIALMLVILAAVGFAIEKGRSVQLQYGGRHILIPVLSLAWRFVLVFGLMCVFAAVGYAVLATLRRSGVHRLSNIKTWPITANKWHGRSSRLSL